MPKNDALSLSKGIQNVALPQLVFTSTGLLRLRSAQAAQAQGRQVKFVAGSAACRVF